MALTSRVTTPLQISLPAELREFVDDEVGSGRSASPSALVSEALLQFKNFATDHQTLPEHKLAEVRASIATGLDELESGHGEPWDPSSIKAEIRARLG